MKHTLLFLSIFLLNAGITACSVKAKSDDVPAAPQEKSVKGPDLSGTWSSGCQKSNFGEYKSIDAVFTTATISRKATTYSNSGCETATDSREQVGTYRFVQANKDGSFTVEYKISIGQGVSALPQEKVLLDNGMLYLSDFALGDAITKDNMIPLRKTQTRQ